MLMNFLACSNLFNSSGLVSRKAAFDKSSCLSLAVFREINVFRFELAVLPWSN